MFTVGTYMRPSEALSILKKKRHGRSKPYAANDSVDIKLSWALGS